MRIYNGNSYRTLDSTGNVEDAGGPPEKQHQHEAYSVDGATTQTTHTSTSVEHHEKTTPSSSVQPNIKTPPISKEVVKEEEDVEEDKIEVGLVQGRSLAAGGYEDLIDELPQQDSSAEQEDDDDHQAYDPSFDDSGSFIEEVIEDSEGNFLEEEIIEEEEDDKGGEYMGDDDLEGILEEAADIMREDDGLKDDSQEAHEEQQQEEDPEDADSSSIRKPVEDVHVVSSNVSTHSGLSLGTEPEDDEEEQDQQDTSTVGARSTASEAAANAADVLLGVSAKEATREEPVRQSSQRSAASAVGATAAGVAVAAAVKEQQASPPPTTPPPAGYYIRRPSQDTDDRAPPARDPSTGLPTARRSNKPVRDPSGQARGAPSHRADEDPARIREVQQQSKPPQPQPKQQRGSGSREAGKLGAMAAIVAADKSTQVAPNAKQPQQQQQEQAKKIPKARDKIIPDTKDADRDLEAGVAAKRKASEERESAKAATAAASASNRDDETSNSNRLYGAICCCVLVLVLVIVLPIVLTRDDDDGATRDITISTMNPVAAPVIPTQAPTSLGVRWTERFPELLGPENSGFGASVSMDENVLIVGAPFLNGTGGVYSAVYSGVNETWVLQPSLMGEEDGSEFGAAMDVMNGQMIVGAPLVNLEDNLLPVGAAYFYAFNPSANEWVQIGPVLQGDQDILAAGGDFGAAVALGLSSLPRVVIGSPRSSLDTTTFQTGRVYTYEGNGISWTSLEAEPLVGKTENDWFGASVDMTSDGSRFIVGAPGMEGAGMDGYFHIYEWDGTGWTMEFDFNGESGESLGASVVALSDDLFAVGAPAHRNDRGRVLVFERQSDGAYNLIGEVEGDINEKFGRGHSVTGGVDEGGLLLILSTATGDVLSFGSDGGGISLNSRVQTRSTGSSDLVVEYSARDGLVTGSAARDHVYVLEVSAPFVVVPEETTPTSAPISTITQSPVAAPAPTATDEPPSRSPVRQVLPTTAPVIITETETSSTPPPAPSTQAPAPPSTDAPTLSLETTMGWVQSASNFLPRLEGSAFGRSVSLSSSRMAVGAPLTLGNGGVFVYQKIGGTWETEASTELFGEAAGDEFGAAVDVTDRLLIVGAPRVLIANTPTEAGAAYCYISNGGEWEQLGQTLRGDETIFQSNELFGSSVAASTTGVVVVGAPGSVIGAEMGSQGRVYVFEFSDAASEWTLTKDVQPLGGNVVLGAALDISRDGSRFLVGAPAGSSGGGDTGGGTSSTGYVQVFQYNGLDWISVGTLQGSATDEAFGSAVAMISPSGDIIAIGAPGFMNGRGRVVVYQQNTAGNFVSVGPAIVGEEGERLGATVAGESSSPTVFLGTAQGLVKEFSYDADTNLWVVGGTVDTGFGSDLQAVSVASQSQAIVVGGNNDAAIFEPSR